MKRLTGKKAVIIGAASRNNMAQTIARRLVAEGATVCVSGRNADELCRLSDEIGCQYVTCDITSRQENLALVDEILDRFGGLDIAINATGWGLLKPFELTTDEELQAVCDLQFMGPFRFFQAVLPKLAKGGSIVQISSATATIMLENHAAYMGTKAGFDHVIRCIANEYGGRGIRANSVSPGFTLSPMTTGAASVPGLIDLYQESYPLGRLGTQDDIASAVVWLCSDECFMTGENLQVNGGLTLRRNPTFSEMDEVAIRETGKPRPKPWESPPR